MGVTLDVSQVHGLASDLRGAADEAPRRVAGVMAHGARATVEAIQAGIRAKDRIDTSEMLESVSADVSATGFEAGPTVPYAVYQDQGTSEVPAANFTGNGFDAALPGIEAELARVVGL